MSEEINSELNAESDAPKKRRRKRIEPRFLAEFKESINTLYPTAFYHKLTDSVRSFNSRFIPEKPFDLFIAYNKVTVAIEAKAHGKPTAWPLSAVKADQLDALELAQVNGWRACVMLNWRYGLGKLRFNNTYLIPTAAFRRWQMSGTKSVRPVDLERVTGIKRLYWVKLRTDLVGKFPSHVWMGKDMDKVLGALTAGSRKIDIQETVIKILTTR